MTKLERGIIAWALGFPLGLALVCCAGCNPMHEMRLMLENPGVQSTLEKWSLEGDFTNPSIGFFLVNGGELRATGVIARGDISGNVGSRGVDPDLLRTLTEIAVEWQRFKATLDADARSEIEDANTSGLDPTLGAAPATGPPMAPGAAPVRVVDPHEPD